MEVLFPLLMIVGVIVAIVVIVLSAQARKAKIETWRQFALTHGLKLLGSGSFGNPRIMGQWQGIDITLQIEVQGSGKHSKTFTRASARISRPMPRGLNITSEGFTDRVAKLLGGQDIQIGTPELVRQLRIRAEDEVATRILMKNWRARNAIASFIVRDGKAVVSQHQVTTRRLGFISSDTALRDLVACVTRTVREVEAAVDNPEAKPGSAPQVAAGTLPSRRDDTPPRGQAGPPSPPELPLDAVEMMQDVGVDMGALGISSATVHTQTENHGETVLGSGVGAPPPTVRQVSRSVDENPPRPPQLLDFEIRAMEPPTPEVAPAQPPAEQEPVVIAAGEPVPLEALLALNERTLSSSEQRAAAAALLGRPCAISVEVERVAITMGLDVPPALEDGRTIVGKPAGHRGPRLSVRFTPAHGERVSGLSYGDILQVDGTLTSWDEFYRQAVIDVK